MSFDVSALANRPTSRLRAHDSSHGLPARRARLGEQLAECGSNETVLAHTVCTSFGTRSVNERLLAALR